MKHVDDALESNIATELLLSFLCSLSLSLNFTLRINMYSSVVKLLWIIMLKNSPFRVANKVYFTIFAMGSFCRDYDSYWLQFKLCDQ